MTLFETTKEHQSILLESQLLELDEVFVVKNNRIAENANDVVQLIIELSDTVIPYLAAVIITYLNTKREFNFEHDGEKISFKGYSIKSIETVLRNLVNKKN